MSENIEEKEQRRQQMPYGQHNQAGQQPYHMQHMSPSQQIPMSQLQPQFPMQLTVPTPAGAPIVSPQMGASPYAGYMMGQQEAQQPIQLTPGGFLPLEMSYVENILRFNRGKRARVYMTFEYNPDWTSRVFEGIIEEAGRDHIILSNPEEGRYYLLLMLNLDYVEFDEPIAYVPQVLPPGVVTASPR
jgi:spore germination protein Q